MGVKIDKDNIENDKYKVQLNKETGHVSSVYVKELLRTIEFKEELYQYTGETTYRPSGAYSFHPTGWDGIHQYVTSDRSTVYNFIYTDGKPEIISVFSTPNDCSSVAPFILNSKSIKSSRYEAQFMYIQNPPERQYLAILPINEDNINKDAQFNIVNIGSKSSETYTTTILFEKPFSDKNVFVKTEFYNVESNEYFISNILSINQYNFTVIITCVNGNNLGWKSNLDLHYVAYVKSPFQTYYTHMDVVTDKVELKMNDNELIQEIELPSIFRENYYVLCEVKSNKESAVIVNILETSPDKFSVHLYEINKKNDLSIELFYILVPKDAPLDSVKGKVNPTIISGNLVEEIQIEYKTGYAETIRLYNMKYDSINRIEYIHTFGQIDEGSEVIYRIKSDINNGNKFYADLNGLEDIERSNIYKDISENVAGNYYPSVSRTYIQDNEIRLTLLHDRAHGVSGLGSGNIEVMLQRKSLYDDGYGVGEPLKDNAPFEAKSWMLIDTIDNSIKQHKKLSRYLVHPPLVFYHKDTPIIQNHSLLKKDLPDNLELLSYHSMDNSNRITIRFHHINEIHEKELANTIKFDINDIFSCKFTDTEEMILTGYYNKDTVESERLKWKTHVSDGEIKYTKSLHGSTITLEPMEISTIVTTVN